MDQKSKRDLLYQRLDRIKKNSQLLINKMDNQINSIQNVKNDLDDKSQRMTIWTNKFQQVMHNMAQNMFGTYKNPLVQDLNINGLKPRKQSLDFVIKKVMNANKICVLTGAGVSKNSGIPTFRGKEGMYNKKFSIKTNTQEIVQYSPQQFLTLKTFHKHPQQIWKWCQSLRQLVQQKNYGSQHELINRLCKQLKNKGKKVTLVTTNIDSYHVKLAQKNDPDQKFEVHQIHGHFRKYICSNCFCSYPIMQNRSNFVCKQCNNNVLRPFIMFFDQRYDQNFDPSNLRAEEFDLIFVIGSSLQTGLSIRLVSRSKVVVQINPQCIIKSGEVYQFQQQCSQALNKILIQLLKQNNTKKIA